MIISEDNENPTSPTKSSLLSPIDTSAQRRDHSPGPAPPSYTVATSASPTSPLLPYHSNTQSAQQVPHSSMGHPPSSSIGGYSYPYKYISEEEQRHAARKAQRRFMKAFLLALLCYLILTTWVSTTFDVGIDLPRIGIPGTNPISPKPSTPPHKPTSPNEPDTPTQPDDPSEPDDDGSYPDDGDKGHGKPWPGKWDGDIIACWDDDSWSSEPPSGVIKLFNQDIILVTGPEKDSDFPYTSYRSLTLPADAPGLALFSKGNHATGTVALTVSESDKDDNLVQINMQASYKHPRALEWTTVCELEDRHRRSIGIYTSRDHDSLKDIRIKIDVQFPKGSKSFAPLNIPGFTLAFSSFNYDIATLDQVFFGHLTLATDNDRIDAKGVVAKNITAATSNGGITGSYNVSGSGVFATSNGKIDVDLNVFDEDDKDKGADITLSTSNGAIKAYTNLWHIPTHESANGGKFHFTASTKNAPNNVTFATAPVDSILESTVSTSNGRVDVALHPTYEGDLTLATSNGATKIHIEDGVEDPSGRGRERIVNWSTVWKNWAIGWVGWGEKKKAGTFTATTSNAALYVSL